MQGRTMLLWSGVMLAGLAAALRAQTMQAPAAKPPMAAPGAAMAGSILPTGLGEAIDRDVAKLRAATARYKSSGGAIAAGYAAADRCVEHQPHGAMGYHFNNQALMDAVLEVDKPEVLVYEKRPDGTFQFNGVEYLVPISAWKESKPPSIMGQDLKRADSLGIWYLHVWSESVNPSGLFADWNPRVKC